MVKDKISFPDLLPRTTLHVLTKRPYLTRWECERVGPVRPRRPAAGLQPASPEPSAALEAGRRKQHPTSLPLVIQYLSSTTKAGAHADTYITGIKKKNLATNVTK